VVCSRCRRPILPGTAWQLDHDDYDRTLYRGPSHSLQRRRRQPQLAPAPPRAGGHTTTAAATATDRRPMVIESRKRRRATPAAWRDFHPRRFPLPFQPPPEGRSGWPRRMWDA